MRKYVFLPLLALLSISGCVRKAAPGLTAEQLARIPFPQRSGLPEPAGGFVLAADGETITSEEMVGPLVEPLRSFAQNTDFQRFRMQTRTQFENILTLKISNILLYRQAKKELGENVDEALNKAADVEVRKFIVSFGGDYARAEDTLKQMGMDWDGFKEYQKKMILSQYYMSSKIPKDRSITYSELLDCYNGMKEGLFTVSAVLRFRLIDIEASKLEQTDPNVSRQQQARKLADELLVRLKAGEDFGEMAKQYSHGHMRESGGLWKPVQPASLAKPYDVLASEAERMEPGQITGPIETDGHIFIMKLEEKQPGKVEPFENVQKELEAKINFERRKKAVDEFGAKLMQQASLGKRNEFVDFCLAEIYIRCNR